MARLNRLAVGIVFAFLTIIGATVFATAEDPQQELRVRVAADLNDDGTTSLQFQQFTNGEWRHSPITEWTASVPSLGVDNPTWTSESFFLTVSVPVPAFGLPAPTIDPPEMPAEWKPPTRERSGVRWGFRFYFDPSDGWASVSKDMKLLEGRSPATQTENIVQLHMFCRASGTRGVLIVTDVPPTAEGYSVVWWTDGSGPHAENWRGRDIQNNDFFAADAIYSSGMIEELREASSLYVTIWGDNSWRSAKMDISHLFDTDVQEVIDYCGQQVEEEPSADGSA